LERKKISTVAEKEETGRALGERETGKRGKTHRMAWKGKISSGRYKVDRIPVLSLGTRRNRHALEK